jgi:N-acetylmuramoyl-L-alanine amidase
VQLRRYVRQHKLYHYLIDRFGRVYRVVEEESKANHAGNSVWARGEQIHMNLNHAFLGVSFETRWEGGRALPITQAQFAAGRNLADWLRQRWEIPADMCVAHGLTSVNPKKHLIGHHMDWARGFPFEAFGLPNQYQTEPASVAQFGFGYDEDFLKVLGEPWAGVQQAERALAGEAARQGKTVEQVRRERQALYDVWLGEQARAEAEAAAGRLELTRGADPGAEG